MIRQS